MALSRFSSKNWFDSDAFNFGTLERSTSSTKRLRDDDDFFTPQPKRPSMMKQNDELWIDRYKPLDTEQLAVQAKKVGEVRTWLLDHQDKGGILLLQGPPGSGKTAVIDCLARELCLDIQEWINPVTQIDFNQRGESILEEFFRPEDRADYVSQEKKFVDWVRQQKYSSQLIGTGKGKLILLEDYPDFALKKTSVFQEFLVKYSKNLRNPCMVLIHSEGSKGQEPLAKNLFKPENLTNLGIQAITLNAATTTNITKLLTRILTEENKKNGNNKLQIPDKQALEQLCESTSGDIRASINALQFSCLDSLSSSLNNNLSSLFLSDSSTPSSKKSKKVAAGRGGKRQTAAAQSSVGCKDQNLGLFHALGKVLYAKRRPEKELEPLASHLERHRRNKLEAVPEQVFDKACISEDGFANFLHHNYPAFYTSVQDVDRLASYLSEADLLLQDWGITGKMDIKEYGLSVSTRSIMFCNQNPAKVVGLRKMNKPELYAVKKKIDVNILNTETALGGLMISQPRKEVFTSTLPLLARIKPPALPVHKLATLVEIGRFPGVAQLAAAAAAPPQPPKPNQTSSDGFEEDLWSEDDDQLFLNLTEGGGKEKKGSTEEDFDIQDYDDDEIF